MCSVIRCNHAQVHLTGSTFIDCSSASTKAHFCVLWLFGNNFILLFDFPPRHFIPICNTASLPGIGFFNWPPLYLFKHLSLPTAFLRLKFSPVSISSLTKLCKKTGNGYVGQCGSSRKFKYESTIAS